MNIPRLIIADESSPGIVPSALTLCQAMKSMGMRINVFCSARSEEDIRLLKLLTDGPVYNLDLYTFHSARNLKTHFQRTADPRGLNLILVPLGVKIDEKTFQAQPEPLELARVLDCGIVPVIASTASAIVTSNMAITALASLEAGDRNYVQGLLFASAKNPREFQLMEQDYNRRTSTLSLGYIPKEIERPRPFLNDLTPSSAPSRIFQIRSASLQLANAKRQVEWKILEALSFFNESWTPPEALGYSARNLAIAVVGDGINVEGDSNIDAFQALGCNIHRYNPWEENFPRGADALYFPHSMIRYTPEKLLENDDFRAGILQSVAANKLILVNGASALLFGQTCIAPDGRKLEGLGVFPFHGRFAERRAGGGHQKIEIRGINDTNFSKANEKMRGYVLSDLHISNPGNLAVPSWSYRDIRKDAELGTSGWIKNSCFVTELRLELWSCLNTLNRWLLLCKR
ncbi:MAG: hypothetical protein GX256_05770 [Fretibacterium sp.]|nr:hypothetical protein [Fretibacterium sp.]